MTRKLTRSRNQRIIAGVCGGIAETYNLDVNIVRIVTAVAALVTSGFVAVLYLAAALFLPEEGTGVVGADKFYDMYGGYRERRTAAYTEPAPADPTRPTDVFDPYAEPGDR